MSETSKKRLLLAGALVITQQEAARLRPGIRPLSTNGKKIVTPGLRQPAGRKAAGSRKNKRLKTVTPLVSDLYQEFDVIYGDRLNPSPPNHAARAISIELAYPYASRDEVHKFVTRTDEASLEAAESANG